MTLDARRNRRENIAVEETTPLSLNSLFSVLQLRVDQVFELCDDGVRVANLWLDWVWKMGGKDAVEDMER